MEKLSKEQFMAKVNHKFYVDELEQRRVNREVDIYIHKKACRMKSGKKGMERYE